MFLILDESGSMSQPFDNNDSRGDCDVGETTNSRWCNSINSIHGFFADETSVGTGVSYAPFSGGSCSAFDMELDFGIVEANDSSGQLASLESALNAGLQAVERTWRRHSDDHETSAHKPSGTRKAVSIFVTDGEPSRDCRGTTKAPPRT